ncbi:putative methyl-accepting chemotaxis citrate transducer (Citrate chemorecitrate transducer protein) [Desulfamplus magnetovallimortis]|uniref:Putative methyl-accepting chemotaxis citrate transducer (Citrate chemorecitrate transducer protein) n=1 Tax=Desulfamplus magnetovallimortis TaxID=1246637 RepID=A0A1W1HJ34_9BACT|nr:methyl-accepting chemotaxis protein [Desulfamplus magnetovallimortis]SLM32489.1 putative methyl-accepting chemotaxis citrate transducer (Citrate chemorecitrate transducer protein) [Desulfamplus magnetovallimortis]
MDDSNISACMDSGRESVQFEEETANNEIITGGHKSFLTLGMKLVVVVGLVSSLCIGLLVFVNWNANRDISVKIEGVTALRDGLSQHLRNEIVNLQDKYLQIPQYFEVNPTKDILTWIDSNYPDKSEQFLKGRSQYASLFSRTQKRDISKGKFITHIMNDSLIVVQGLMDEHDNFMDSVKMIQLPCADPQKERSKVNAEIDRLSNSDSKENLTKTIASLTGMLADEAIEAEKVRNEIVQFVNKIVTEDLDIKKFRQQKERLTFFIAMTTIIVNLMVLYLVTWFVIEKPLRTLAQVISRIQKGQKTEIPFKNRFDKVGVLARTVQGFKEALENLKNEGDRKHEEQKMVKGLIALMTEMIHSLGSKSKNMAEAASTLHDLAISTESQSSQVNDSANHTAANTDAVSEAAGRLQISVENIGSQIKTQNDLVEKMISVTEESMTDIDALDKASTEIASIIKIVRDISGQTKLLALNANIEAARSDSGGNGFSVVASEIRTLSNQTETATGDISEKILAIQQASHNIIDSIKSMKERISSLSQAGKRIEITMSEQKQATADIVRNADMTACETQDVSGRIQEVKSAAEQTRILSGRVEEESRNLLDGLDDLLGNAMQKLSIIGMDSNSLLCVRRNSGKNDAIKESNKQQKGFGSKKDTLRTMGTKRCDSINPEIATEKKAA